MPENKPLIDLQQLVEDAAEYLEIARAESLEVPGLQRVDYTDKIVTVRTGNGKRIGRVNYVNRRLFDTGGYEWLVGMVRGYCLEPTFQEGDVSIIALGVLPEEGDVVAIEKDSIQTSGYFHKEGDNSWIEQPQHGYLPLEGCRIIGAIVVNARFSRTPYYEVDPGPAPQCQNCPTVLLLLDMIALLCQGKNPNFPHGSPTTGADRV